MEPGERIKALRANRGMTQRELGERMGVTTVSIRCWENGTKAPSMSAIVTLAEIFGVSSDYLLGVEENTDKDKSLLSTDENKLIEAYRTLDDYGKRAVNAVCGVERERVAGKKITPIIQQPPYKNTPAERERVIKQIPLYALPAAAGAASYATTEGCEMMDVTDGAYAKADYAVRIEGDSMMPHIKDGQIVYVKDTNNSGEDIQPGEVGIFNVNGTMVCKQFYGDEKRGLALVSSNPKRKYTNVYANHDDSDMQVQCCGIVIMPYKIDYPEYFLKEIAR